MKLNKMSRLWGKLDFSFPSEISLKPDLLVISVKLNEQSIANINQFLKHNIILYETL